MCASRRFFGTTRVSSRAMPSELTEIRRQLAEIAAKLPQRKRKPDPNPCIVLRVTPAELAALDAACAARGVTRSALLRDTTLAAIGVAIRPRGEFPGFKRHRKPDRFDDGKTNLPERDKASVREDAARRAMQAGLERQAALRDGGFAPIPAPTMQGMISDAASDRFRDKPGGR